MCDTTLSFGPAGTWSMYHAGVALYLLEHIKFNRDQATCYVVSGGALGLTALLYDDPRLLIERSIAACKIMSQLRNYGLFAPLHMRRICRLGLDCILPDDAHLRLNDRVYIGTTHFPSFAACYRQGPFKTKEELLDALLTSSYIPGFFFGGYVPGYSNLMDGGFSHHCCPRPELSLVTTVAKYEHSDIYHDTGTSFHLRLMGEQDYLDIMWLGYEAAKRNRDQIITKLKRTGLYQGEE